MEKMIDDGAKIIFATSLRPPRPGDEGRRRRTPTSSSCSRATSSPAPCRRTPARTSAPCTSRCTSPASPPGRSTESNKLGYVYAFPIPQTIANINAFQLGAQSVNPDVETYVVNTSNWCDPAKQAEAASSLHRPGRRRHHPAPGLHGDDHQGGRGGRHRCRRLPRRRLGAGAQRLGHRLGVGLGRPLQRHRRHRARRRVHRLAVQRQLPGRLQGRRQPVRAVGVRLDGRRGDQGADRRAARARSRRPARRSPARSTAQDGTHAVRGRRGRRLRRDRGDATRPSSRASSARSPRADGDRRGDARRRHRPYPWPYDGALDAGTHWPSWCAAPSGGSSAACRRRRTPSRRGSSSSPAHGPRAAAGVVVWVRHGAAAAAGPRRRRSCPVRGDAGWQLAVEPAAGDVRRRRRRVGRLLRRPTSTTRCAPRACAPSCSAGIASELTVDSTVRTLNDRGHECLVLTDGCAPLDADARRPRPPQPDDVGRHLRRPRHHRPPSLDALVSTASDQQSHHRKEQLMITGTVAVRPRTPGPTTASSTPPARPCCASTGRPTSAGRAATSTRWATTSTSPGPGSSRRPRCSPPCAPPAGS